MIDCIALLNTQETIVPLASITGRGVILFAGMLAKFGGGQDPCHPMWSQCYGGQLSPVQMNTHGCFILKLNLFSLYDRSHLPQPHGRIGSWWFAIVVDGAVGPDGQWITGCDRKQQTAVKLATEANCPTADQSHAVLIGRNLP